MKLKKLGIICGILALLAPFLQMLIEQLDTWMELSDDVHILLCVGSAVCGILALTVSIIIDIRGLKEEKQISKRNKRLIYTAIVLGVIIFSILFIMI